MIITQAMVEFLGGCESGLVFMRSYSPMFPNGIEFQKAVEIVNALGKDELVENLMSNKGKYIRMSDKYTKGGYRYFCLRCSEATYFDNLEQANSHRDAKRAEDFNAEIPKYTIAQEIECDNGDVTWVAISYADLVEEDRYQVFDPMVGTHTLCKNLQAVKDFIHASIDARIDQHLNCVEQEIFSGYGDSEWVSADQTDPILFSEHP